MPRDITTGTTLGDIATRWPELIEYMESRELDYCCGGSRTVAQAADRAGINPEELVGDLRSFEGPNAQDDDRDWSAASMTELADHIEETHHAYVRRTLDRLDELSERCVEAHAESDPRLHELRKEFLAFDEDMHDHMVREERVLFPWLRRLEKPTSIESGPPWSVRRPIDCMLHDHDDAAGALDRMRALTDNFTPPENACATRRDLLRLLEEIERDTHLHIHKENNILFPAGVEAERRRKEKGEPRGGSRQKAARSGFTLIELLFAIAIIAVLISIRFLTVLLLVPAVGVRTGGLL